MDFEKSYVITTPGDGLDPNLTPTESVKESNLRKFYQSLEYLQKIGYGQDYFPTIWSQFQKKEKTQLMTRGLEWLSKTYDTFMLGKTVLSLNWPCHTGFLVSYNKIETVESLSKFRKGDQRRRPSLTSESGDLLDFVNRLTARLDPDGIGFNRSDKLIEHALFRRIDFEKLRQKAILAPVHDLLQQASQNRALPIMEQATPTPQRLFCERLSEDQKKIFHSNYFYAKASN